MRTEHLIAHASRVNGRRAGRKPNFTLVAIAVRADGAVVCSRNSTTHTPQPTAHAEARVLRKAGVGATVYVFRFAKDGTLSMAKPCVTCQHLLRAKHAEVFYTDWTGQLQRLTEER